MHKINRIGVFQTAKVIGIIYFFISAVIAIPFGLLGFLGEILNAAGGYSSGLGVFMAILIPLFYGFLGFLGTAIVCWIYNLIAGSNIGGIELDIEKLGMETEDIKPS
jgi:hypothetical protein